MANNNDCFNRSTTVNETSADRSRPTTTNELHEHSSRSTTVNQQFESVTRETTVNKSPDRRNSFMSDVANVADSSSKKTTTNANRNTTPNIVPPNPIPAVFSHTEGIAEGTVIDQYTVGQPIHKKSGEAVLYRCVNCKGEDCVLKYFQRDLSDEDIDRHDDLLSRLENIKDGVVKIRSSGKYEGHLYEIMPYYKNGSLKDQLELRKRAKKAPPYFSEREIVEDIFPRLLKILKSIHDQGIYHADIKPENIMYKNSRCKDLVLIDFGVSRVTHGSGTTFITIVGGTADYQAPEMHSGTLWEGTDYYALGITLFELFVGAAPTAYKQNTKDVERSALLDSIPRVDGMSDDFYRLIYYLTFDSVRNRHNRKNHSNRWIYQEASMWPEDGWPNPGDEEPDIPINVRFNNKTYESMDELIFALAGDWNRGKNYVARPEGGLVSGLAKSGNRDRRLLPLSKEVDAFVELATKSSQSEDVILFEFIYQYGHEITPIFWKGSIFTSLDELGQAVLRSLSGDISEQNPFYELFTERLLEVYMKHRKDLSTAEQVKIMRVCDINFGNNLSYKMYEAAYALIDEKYYYLQNGEYIKTPAGLKAYLAREGKKGNLLGFMNLCREFIDDSGKEKDGFKAWLDANVGASDQTMDVQKEIESLSPIPDDGPNLQFDSRIAEKSKPKGRFWGIPLGMIILAITIVPFSLFILALNNGTIAVANVTMKYVFLIAAIGLPIIPILMARLLCIPRNRVTNTCFGFVSFLCRIMKYDVLVTGAALVFDRYSSILAVNAVTRTIRSGYAWILQTLRNVIGNPGTDRLLDSLAQKINISYPWFNDVVRLIVVFIIYTLIIAIFRRRKVKK